VNDWDSWDDEDREPRRGAAAAAPAGSLPAPRFPDSPAWVSGWLATTVRRHVNEKRAGQLLAWCPSWAAHPEAEDRIEGMWRAWEAAQASTDPAAIAHWWLKIADPMLKALMDPDQGPFSDCRRNGHTDTTPPLPLGPAPDGSPST
jgi:hypothetical protein